MDIRKMLDTMPDLATGLVHETDNEKFTDLAAVLMVSLLRVLVERNLLVGFVQRVAQIAPEVHILSSKTLMESIDEAELLDLAEHANIPRA